jgi:hypothetical protein
MRTQPPPVAPPQPGFDLFEVWKQYEALSQHFNDLLMRLRSQSLAAVATFATAASVLLKADAIGADFRWGSLLAVFGSLSVFWIAIWLLDFLYYNRLLLGTVAALLEIEKQSKVGNRISEINLSTLIKKAVERPRETGLRTLKGLWWFYVLVSAVLVLATAISVYEFQRSGPVTRVELAGLVIASVTPGTLMLTEGKVTKAITLAPTTNINVNGQKATAAELKPGMTVKVTLDPDPSTASRIDATGK